MISISLKGVKGDDYSTARAMMCSVIGMEAMRFPFLIESDRLTDQELTYNGLYDSIENIWSVLFMTGYLTQRGKPEGDLFRLVIPNREIRKIFTDQVMTLFKEQAKKDGAALEAFCSVLQNGDAGAERIRIGSEFI